MANAYSIPTNFLQKWAATETKGKSETGRVKIFQRFTSAGGHIYSIASITFMQYPSKKDESIQNFAKTLPDAFGENKWQTSSIGNSTIVEGVWKKGNRYVRYDITKSDGFITVTMFTGRLGYIDSLLSEARVIQSNLARVKPPLKVGAFDILNRFLGIPEARADLQDLLNKINQNNGNGLGNQNGSGTGNGLGNQNSPGTGIGNLGNINNGNGGGVFPDMTGTTSSMDSLSQSFIDLNSQMGLLNQNIQNSNQNWSNTNAQLNNTSQMVDQNWNNTNHKLDAATQVVDQNWNNTNQKLDAATQVANKNWGETNKVVDKNWAETNNQLSRANDLAAKLADPSNAFKLAAATSAGMVFGATLANLAIDGVVWGAKMVYDLITDTSGKKERWDKFKEARGQWENTENAAKSLERLLDNFLNSQELLSKIQSSLTPEDQDKFSRENLISFLSEQTRKAQKTKKELEEEYSKTSDQKCEAELSAKIDDVEKKIGSSSAVKDYLNRQNYKIYNSEVFCSELKQIMGKLGEAEAALQTYRLNILNARDQWEKESAREREYLADVTERVNDRDIHEKTLNARIKNAKSDYEKVLESIDDDKDHYIDECRRGTSFFTRLTGGGKDCEKEYNLKFRNRDEEMKYQARMARARKIENAKKDFEESNKHFMLVNQDIEDAKMQSYYGWFSNLEKQQYCFAHQEEPECKKLGEIKFMGPFYIKKRAQVKLRDICKQDIYSY